MTLFDSIQSFRFEYDNVKISNYKDANNGLMN